MSEGNKGGKKREKNTDMKVLLAWRALGYSFLNLNYLEQKHCCLKSAFSGAYFSRLPLTQDWLPFSGLTCPRNDPDPLTPTFPSVILQGCGSCRRCQCQFQSIGRLTRALYVDVVYIGLQCVCELRTNHELFKHICAPRSCDY